MVENVLGELDAEAKRSRAQQVLALYPIDELLAQYGITDDMSPTLAELYVDYSHAANAVYRPLWHQLVDSLAHYTPQAVYRDRYEWFGRDERAVESVWGFHYIEVLSKEPRELKVAIALPWSTTNGSTVDRAIQWVNSSEVLRQPLLDVEPRREPGRLRKETSKIGLKYQLGRWLCANANTISVVTYSRALQDSEDLKISKTSGQFTSFPAPSDSAFSDPELLEEDLRQLNGEPDVAESLQLKVSVAKRHNIGFYMKQAPLLQKMVEVVSLGSPLGPDDPAIRPCLSTP